MSPLRTLVLLCALAGSGLLSGCSKQDGGADAGTDAGVAISPVELCDRMATARCALLARCYPGFLRDTPSQCHADEQARCLDRYTALKPSFESGAVQIDPGQVQACEQRMADSSCPGGFPPTPTFSGLPTAFADCSLDTGLLRGTVPSGEVCTENVECTPGSVCVKPGGVCHGTCSALGKVDEPCGFGCASGLYCDSRGTADPVDDVCAPLLEAGKACRSSRECRQELWCDGTCKPKGSVGDPCRIDLDTISTCAPGLACDLPPFVDAVGKCVLPVQRGGPCYFHWSCAPGLVCYDLEFQDFPNALPQVPGSCQQPVPAQTNCPYTPYAGVLGDACAAGLACSPDGVCAPRPSLGQSCHPEVQDCSGLDTFCKPAPGGGSGTCTTAAQPGDTCAVRLADGSAVAIPCASGYCDVESTLTCLPPSKQIGEVCAANGECVSGRCAVQEDRTRRCAAACL